MNYIERLLKPNLLRIFLLGICSGFPWVLISSAMAGWLTDAGLSRTAIGAFGSITFVYAINFIWAPIIDRCRLMPKALTTQRKGWIMMLLILMAIFAQGIASASPQTSFWVLSLFALGIAIASATMDIAIDAYRVEHAAGEDVPIAAALATSGWWTGYSVLGAAAFLLKGQTDMSWAQIFFALSLFCVFMAILVWLLVQEHKSQREKIYQEFEADIEQNVEAPILLARITATMILPFADLLKRYGALVICLLLAFLFSFKMGEAFLGRMSITFYKQIGYTDTQIGTYSKLVTWVVTIIFSLIGAYLNVRLGVFKGILVGGIAMASTNLLFAFIAIIGPDETAFLVAVLLDGFTSAFATVVLVSFITHLTSQTFSASQYALLASLANFGRTTVSSASGWVVDLMSGNWALFFVLTALMIIPSLVILYYLRKAMLARDLLATSNMH